MVVTAAWVQQFLVSALLGFNNIIQTYRERRKISCHDTFKVHSNSLLRNLSTLMNTFTDAFCACVSPSTSLYYTECAGSKSPSSSSSRNPWHFRICSCTSSEVGSQFFIFDFNKLVFKSFNKKERIT